MTSTIGTSAERIAGAIAAELAALPHPSLADLRAVRRRWSSALRAEAPDAALAVAEALTGTPAPRFLAYEVALHHPGAIALVDADAAERLAGRLASWGEVDAFATLVAGPAWLGGRVSDADVMGWAASGDRWWRRAALVATTGLNVPSRGGHGDAPRTIAVCERLVGDRDDTVVKALSWALRELVRHDPDAVARFLEEHAGDMAPRVRREVTAKLTTGLKQGWRSGRDVD
jgi:3-methyladenine DNA glycosylase AlkD